MSVSNVEERKKIAIKTTDNEKKAICFSGHVLYKDSAPLMAFIMLLFCTTIVIMPLRSGTCGLNITSLTRCVVRTREIRLIIMIRVEVLSIGNGHFTRAFSRSVEGRYVSWSVKFLIAFRRCPFRDLLALNLVSQFCAACASYSLNPRIHFQTWIVAKLTLENYTDLLITQTFGDLSVVFNRFRMYIFIASFIASV